mmetsp:Transcript_5449/g.12426  ORF Transcript_5449/g.12426 Transcript_5449/m.12426 type:complete len:88 (-) Transcript_5449:16-279(-)
MASPAISKKASRRVAMSSLTSERTGAFKMVEEKAETAGMIAKATQSFILDDFMLSRVVSRFSILGMLMCGSGCATLPVIHQNMRSNE